MSINITFRLTDKEAAAFLAIKDESGFYSIHALAKSLVLAVIEDDLAAHSHSQNGARAAPPPAMPAHPQESSQ